MDAKNFRVGNFIHDLFGDAYRLDLIQLSNLDIMKIKPIELTKKWLVDFGFEVKGIEPDFWEKDDFSGSFFNGEFQLTWYELAPCQYVHQLQNLFFAIKGQELELKDERSTCG